MTAAPHDRFDELVAGHALSALEPEDEQLLLAHLPTCAACERALDVHRETLAHLAYAVDAPPPLPDGVWEGIRTRVVASGTPVSFSSAADAPGAPAAVPAPSAPVDLAAERERRRPRRGLALTSAAAAVVLVGGLLGWNVVLQNQRAEMGEASQRLTAAVQAVETAPAQTVPLRAPDGTVAAVAVLQRDRVSLVVEGLGANDPASSIYVLWGQRGSGPAAALASFDVSGDDLSVVRDLALATAGEPAPEVLAITREPGRTAPAVTAQPVLASGTTA